MNKQTHLQTALVALLLTSSSAIAGGSHAFVDLGTLGGASSVALGLNDAGQVVGWASVPGCTTANGLPCKTAFLWENGQMTSLGFLGGDEGSVARAINNAGLIVGNSERDVLFGSGTYHAVQWTAGQIGALPDLGQGTSWANDVNEAGVIAGYAVDPGPVRDRAVTWTAGAISNVGAAEGHSYNRARGINNSGSLAGFGWNLFEPNDSIHFDGSTWTDIGGLDSPFQNSEAMDVNDAGVVVGLQAFPSGNWHAAYWPVGGHGAVDLGVLPNTDLAELFDVNEAGRAVGRSFTDVSSVAVYSDGTQLIDLNTLLPSGTNAYLIEATEINEGGDIVGTALVDGNMHAFLLLDLSNSGTAFCFGDGSGTACPCGNSGAAGAGCANSVGSGGVLAEGGTLSVLADDLTFDATGLVPNQPALLFAGLNAVNGGSGLSFGDGLRCAGGSVIRLGVRVPDAGGAANWPAGLRAIGGWESGDTRSFQAWYRDPSGSPCGSGFNLSNGVSITFQN